MFLFFAMWAIKTFADVPKKPRVSIICSVYKGDQFIEGFLQDITRQTIFYECELLLINCNSPGNEELIIEPFLKRYPNIRYVKLNYDPGVYGAWNYAIGMVRADLITNANLDDRRNPEILKIHAQNLEQDAAVDLVYSDYYITRYPNETFEQHRSHCLVKMAEFHPHRMHLCLPGPMPMWRKSFHEKYGYFNGEFFSSGDWEMWCRAVSKGARFKRVPVAAGLYYLNPSGLSTDAARDERRKREDEYIMKTYRTFWGFDDSVSLERCNYKA